jgi:hypothetical protein
VITIKAKVFLSLLSCLLLLLAFTTGIQAADEVSPDLEATVVDDVYNPDDGAAEPATPPPTPPIGDGITVYVNYNPLTFDVPPVIENGRTLVPLRAIFEALNAQVEWDGATQTVTAKREDTTIKLTIDKSEAYCNDQEVKLDVPAKLVDGRTIVPLRFISESLGAEVNWNAETQVITINY